MVLEVRGAAVSCAAVAGHHAEDGGAVVALVAGPMGYFSGLGGLVVHVSCGAARPWSLASFPGVGAGRVGFGEGVVALQGQGLVAVGAV